VFKFYIFLEKVENDSLEMRNQKVPNLHDTFPGNKEAKDPGEIIMLSKLFLIGIITENQAIKKL
jgi:hypothetical protein